MLAGGERAVGMGLGDSFAFAIESCGSTLAKATTDAAGTRLYV